MLAQALFIIGAVEQATNARPWMNRNDPAEVRAQKLVDQMTLEEKVALFGGEDCGEDVPCCQGKGDFPGYTGNICSNTRLGIPAIKANDGPQGFRAHQENMAWPCSLAIGATFDTGAARDWGQAMAKEFYAKGANVLLGPGLCPARVPKNGRNFEYLSGEDPYLGYVLVKPVVEAIQGGGVIANAKHWVRASLTPHARHQPGPGGSHVSSTPPSPSSTPHLPTPSLPLQFSCPACDARPTMCPSLHCSHTLVLRDGMPCPAPCLPPSVYHFEIPLAPQFA